MIARVGVGLRPVLPGDLQALRTIELSSRNLPRWRFAGEVPSPDDYRRLLWSGVLEQRVITTTASPQPLGLVNAHRADLRSGTAWLGVVEREDLHGQGVGLAGLALFVDWLFEQWPLRSVHAEVDERNLEQFAGVLDAYAEVGGRLTHRFRDHESYRDVVLLTVRRDRWISTGRPRVRVAPMPSEHERLSFDDICAMAASEGADVVDAGLDTGLAEVGLDSLSVVVMLDEIERRLGRPLPATETHRLRTLGDLWRLATGSVVD
jgi:RimJ/RimL family protein N-acetyltransferase/acyl carrier protein